MTIKHVKITVLFLFIMTLSACSSAYKHVDEAIRPELSQDSSYSKNTEMSIQSIIEEDEMQTISVHYPTTIYDKVNAILSDFALNRIELFRQETASLSQLSNVNWPYELHLDYEIKYQSSRHLSLVFYESKYLSGLKPTSTVYTYTFNVSQQRLLSLKDFFDSNTDYLGFLSQHVSTVLLNDPIVGNALAVDWVTTGTSPLDANFKHFFLENDTLTFIFEKNQVGAEILGDLTVSIPFEVLASNVAFKDSESLVSQATTETETTEPESASEVTSQEASEEATEVVSEPPTEHTKKIAITFEDGPHPLYTPLILDTLSSRNTEATFFLMGIRAKEYDELTHRIFDEGHLIGSHTWSHPQLTRLNADALQNQMALASTSITEITGFTPFLYRPPYGIYNESVLTTGDMPAILWSIDPQDLIYKDSAYITNYVLDHAFDGAIILLRDTNPYTTQSLGNIIDGLEDKGFEIVTVDTLLGLTPENAKSQVRIFSRGPEK